MIFTSVELEHNHVRGLGQCLWSSLNHSLMIAVLLPQLQSSHLHSRQEQLGRNRQYSPRLSFLLEHSRSLHYIFTYLSLARTVLGIQLQSQRRRVAGSASLVPLLALPGLRAYLSLSRDHRYLLAPYPAGLLGAFAPLCSSPLLPLHCSDSVRFVWLLLFTLSK